jgi:DNA-binding winged helix-turn-helix (wHTH) protein
VKAIFEGVLVLVDRPDSSEARADEQMLAAAGARVRAVDAVHQPSLHRGVGQFASVVLLADVTVVNRLSGRLPSLPQGFGGAFCIIVGQGLDSATRASMLRCGADDCMDWPYLPEELAARLEALLRWQPRSRQRVLNSAGLQVDLHHRTVRLFGASIMATPREFDLLVYLLRNPDVVHSRQDLLAEVWGFSFGGTETVTVHIRRLRAKIERDPSRPQRIMTVWGCGYLLVSRVPYLAIAGTTQEKRHNEASPSMSA